MDANKQALQREARRRMMLEDPMMKVIPRVAIPMIISQMIDSIYNLADTFFVSQLGMNATAAVAVNDSLPENVTLNMGNLAVLNDALKGGADDVGRICRTVGENVTNLNQHGAGDKFEGVFL